MSSKNKRGKTSRKSSKKQQQNSNRKADKSESTAPSSTISFKRNLKQWIEIFMTILVLMLAVIIYRQHQVFSPSNLDGGSVTEPLSNVDVSASGDKLKEKSLPEKKSSGRKVHGYTVVSELTHDDTRFIQGLTYHDGYLYEGTGLYGGSNVYKLNATTGETVKQLKVPLPDYLFGEGIAYFNNEIVQLTWKERIGLIYNADKMEIIPNKFLFEFDSHTGEGWGITHDPVRNEFVVSDGSEYLHFWDDETMKEKRRVRVHFLNDNSRIRYFEKLNELEYVNGKILANVWYQDKIISIDPDTGIVDKVYDFTNLFPEKDRGVNSLGEKVDCFNGISISDVEGEVFVTGKFWPKIYRVKLEE